MICSASDNDWFVIASLSVIVDLRNEEKCRGIKSNM